MLFSSVAVAFAAFAALSTSDQTIYDAIRAPRVTGVPPSIALRNMCVLDDGEIRHYGHAVISGRIRRVYASSRDCGLSWKTVLAEKDDPGAMVKSPWSGEWLTIEGMPKVRLVRSKTGPGGRDAVGTDLPYPGRGRGREGILLQGLFGQVGLRSGRSFAARSARGLSPVAALTCVPRCETLQ